MPSTLLRTVSVTTRPLFAAQGAEPAPATGLIAPASFGAGRTPLVAAESGRDDDDGDDDGDDDCWPVSTTPGTALAFPAAGLASGAAEGAAPGAV
jgi:hypothetical protein